MTNCFNNIEVNIKSIKSFHLLVLNHSKYIVMDVWMDVEPAVGAGGNHESVALT